MDERDRPSRTPGGDGSGGVRDSVGSLLADGDQVTLIKNLDVKGAGQPLKRGTLIKSIRLPVAAALIITPSVHIALWAIEHRQRKPSHHQCCPPVPLRSTSGQHW